MMLLPHLNRPIRLVPWETPTCCCLRDTLNTTQQIGVNHCDIMEFPQAPLRVMSLIYYLTERLPHNNILSQFLPITQHRSVAFYFPVPILYASLTCILYPGVGGIMWGSNRSNTETLSFKPSKQDGDNISTWHCVEMLRCISTD